MGQARGPVRPAAHHQGSGGARLGGYSVTLLTARVWSVHSRQDARNFKLGLGSRLPSAEAGSQAAVVVRARARLVAGVTPGQGRESEPVRGRGGCLWVQARGGSE